MVACSGGGADGAKIGASCPGAGETAVHVDTPTGTLAGTLQTPEGCGPYPLVLMYVGSGPTDRDGNQLPSLHTDAYKLLAAALAEKGIASVRHDKRGVGGSRAALRTRLTFDEEVADATSWAQAYVHDERFTGLTLVGHSEGALLALLVAQQVPVRAVVSLEGAGRPIGEVLREQLGKNLAGDPQLVTQANEIIDALEAGRTVASVPTKLQALFDPAWQKYLIQEMRYDPAKELAKLEQPVLVAQGTTDLQVGVKDGQRLAEASPKAMLLLVEGMSHMLKDAAPTSEAQVQSYTDPKLPLDTRLVRGVVRFVKAVSGAK